MLAELKEFSHSQCLPLATIVNVTECALIGMQHWACVARLYIPPKGKISLVTCLSAWISN